MLAYAIDNPAPSTIILITGDRDFAYALSILKHRRYQIVLVTLPNAHASLVHQACVTFDWFNDVVNQLDTSNSQHRHRVQQAQNPDVSNETRSSPCTLANDLTDGEESDHAYSRKQAQRDIYPTYSTANTRAPVHLLRTPETFLSRSITGRVVPYLRSLKLRIIEGSNRTLRFSTKTNLLWIPVPGNPPPSLPSDEGSRRLEILEVQILLGAMVYNSLCSCR
jgi:hypothetical protein